MHRVVYIFCFLHSLYCSFAKEPQSRRAGVWGAAYLYKSSFKPRIGGVYTGQNPLGTKLRERHWERWTQMELAVIKRFFQAWRFTGGPAVISVSLCDYFVSQNRQYHSSILNFFLAAWYGLQDLSSPTRDWTQALSSESAESQPLSANSQYHRYL